MRHTNGATSEVLGRAQATRLPNYIRIGLVRGDSGFGDCSVGQCAETLGLRYLLVARLTQNVQSLCRHEDAAWEKTEIGDLEVRGMSLPFTLIRA